MARDDDLEDDRRPLGDEHLVAQILGARLEVRHRAGSTLSTIESELVVISGTALGVLQTVWQEKESTIEGDGLDLLAPELVGDHDHRKAEVLLGLAHLRQQVLADRLQFRSAEGL